MNTGSIQVEDNCNPALVRLTGRIDPLKLPALEAALSQLVQRGKCRIVLDCTGLRYPGSSGLLLLLHYQKIAQARNGDLKWLGMKEELLSMLEFLSGSQGTQSIDRKQQAAGMFHDVELATGS
jgi:anti-anti-sigma factor